MRLNKVKSFGNILIGIGALLFFYFFILPVSIHEDAGKTLFQYAFGCTYIGFAIRAARFLYLW